MKNKQQNNIQMGNTAEDVFSTKQNAGTAGVKTGKKVEKQKKAKKEKVLNDILEWVIKNGILTHEEIAKAMLLFETRISDCEEDLNLQSFFDISKDGIELLTPVLARNLGTLVNKLREFSEYMTNKAEDIAKAKLENAKVLKKCLLGTGFTANQANALAFHYYAGKPKVAKNYSSILNSGNPAVAIASSSDKNLSNADLDYLLKELKKPGFGELGGFFETFLNMILEISKEIILIPEKHLKFHAECAWAEYQAVDLFTTTLALECAKKKIENIF